MRGNQGDGLLRDARHDLVQVINLGAGVQEDGLVLPFDDVDGFVGHQVAVAFPGMGVDLADDHIGTFIDHRLVILERRHALRTLRMQRITEKGLVEQLLRPDIGRESEGGGPKAQPFEGVSA